jgi:hypothetical protein
VRDGPPTPSTSDTPTACLMRKHEKHSCAQRGVEGEALLRGEDGGRRWGVNGRLWGVERMDMENVD